MKRELKKEIKKLKANQKKMEELVRELEEVLSLPPAIKS